MEGTRFDVIARRVGALGASRRGLIAGAIGVVGAALLGREASAGLPATCVGYKKRCSVSKAGDCVSFCDSLFPDDKKQRKQCESHCPTRCAVECCSGFWTGKKKKAKCGCQADGGSCGYDHHCCSGVCNGNVCARTAGTCPSNIRHTCETFVTCGDDERGNCSCIKTLEGNTACGSDGAFADPEPCSSTAQCVGLYGPGVVCQANESGCAGQRCVVPCGYAEPNVTPTRGAKANLVPNLRGR